jgi:hypothetical protein
VQVLAVKGVPFSAQALTESTQMLADGNRVIRKSTSMIARDSQGRTRREQSLANGASVVLLHDPVTGAGYVLDPQSRSARKNAIPFAENAISTASPNDKSESLGTQIVEGLLAQGSRATRTIPAHEAGNDGSLDIVLETWYATELQTVVASRYIDPRIGEITYKLTEIQRGEPPYPLFQVPAEYSVEEDRPRTTKRPINR